MFSKIVVLAFVATSALAASFTPINKCDSGLPLPTNVKINECKKFPCELARGSYVDSHTTFQINQEYVETLKARVKATSLGVDTDYPLPDPDVCTHLEDASCPLAEGELATYALKFPIFKFLDPVSVNIELTISSEAGDVACFQVECLIV